MITAKDLKGVCWMHSDIWGEICLHTDGSEPGKIEWFGDRPVHWGHLVIVDDAVQDRQVHWNQAPVEVAVRYYNKEWRTWVKQMQHSERVADAIIEGMTR
jgi:hypothetical protein